MKVLYLRIPDDLHEELAAMAEDERRSMTAEAEVLLREAIRNRTKKRR